ncbi:sodium/hydrogen exchanger 10 [Elysia marginata]|uniref:Sodium/hydrogen exchanger 10 n=1 Tax=Elysia marginata TaxID=1093978 RepID=A0AAV4HQ93_9GAST|nr:sodium/hydrogen exchanger 10 [Elysia marginata]
MLRISLPLPQNFIVCLIGILFGYIHEVSSSVDLTSTAHLDPRIAANIILPITLFMAGYYVNPEVFQKPGLHIALYLAVTFGCSFSLMALVVVFLCDWSWKESIMFITIVLPPGPILAKTFLKRLSVSNKLETFMIGEALLSNVLCFFFFKNISMYSGRSPLKFEDFLHEVLFGPLLGYFAAKIVSYWLARIIKDTVNTICIVIASVYFTYILAELAKASPILAIVVMGVCMSGRQSNIEEEAEEIVLRILNVVAMFFSCNLFILVGIELYRYKDTFATARDINNVLLIFVLMAGIRSAVTVTLSKVLKNRGFCLSANNLLVLCTCNIRGSLSIIMCRNIILRGFPSYHPKKMFAYCLAQIALSQLINTVLANTIIRYDILAKYDESRERFISTIMDILDGIRYRSLSANRHGNLSFADADWHTVAKYTELKHPLITVPTTSTQAENTVSPEQEEARSIKRILTIAKCSYRKQYHEGLMSRNALKLLTQWTSHALSRGENMIFPSKIASVLTIPTFYVFLLKNFGKRYKDLSNLQTTCELHRLCLVVFHFVDCVMTVLALVNVLVADDPDRNHVFLVYNLIFVCTHLMWILVGSLIRKNMGLWDMMIVPVVVIGVVDISVFQVMYSESNTARVLRATCVLTRLVRPIRIAGLFLITLKPLMFTCDRMVSQRLMDGYDIGRSYIQARLEVVRLISHVEDVPIRLQQKYKSVLKQHKIEAVKMLGVMQMHCPSTLTTAKTRQATRIVLKRQEYIVKNIQQSRALGEDGAILEKMILTRMSKVNTSCMKISHPDYADIIINVPWIKDLHEVFVKVMEKGVQVNFKKYEIIVSQYEDPGGVFIILNGIAWVQREASRFTLALSKTPFVTVDYLSSGSVIGEYTFLTGKPRHKTIGCYTDLMGLFIKYQILHDVMGGRPSITRPSLFKLEEKMWRVVALRIALRLLMAEPAWLPWSQSQIMMRLVDSVLVDGSDTDKSFNEWVMDYEIVLIHGKLLNLSSNEMLTAPAYIPKQRTTYTFKTENQQRPLMLAIPPVEECDLHVATFDNPNDVMQVQRSDSQYTFSSGSSNNPPHWQLRKINVPVPQTPYRTASETTTSNNRWEVNFGRKALKSFSYPFASFFNRNAEGNLMGHTKKTRHKHSTHNL